MTPQEREDFCGFLAALFSPPDREGIEEGRAHIPFLKAAAYSCGGDRGILAGLDLQGDADALTEEMRKEYDGFFSTERGEEGGGVPLVESCYKPWTQDPRCPLSFASERGLLMGDPAAHLLDVYRRFGLEVVEEFRAVPDHLVMELEFMAYLYRWGTEAQISTFVRDHLDWIPSLREELKKGHPHPFYRSLVEILDLFLRAERRRLENGNDGEKGIL
jgi:TorA maturation chaperone TorD